MLVFLFFVFCFPPCANTESEGKDVVVGNKNFKIENKKAFPHVNLFQPSTFPPTCCLVTLIPGWEVERTFFTGDLKDY